MNGDKLLKIARENPDVTIEDGTIKFVAEIANIDKAAAMLSSQADVTIDDGTQPAPRSKKKPIVGTLTRALYALWWLPFVVDALPVPVPVSFVVAMLAAWCVQDLAHIAADGWDYNFKL